MKPNKIIDLIDDLHTILEKVHLDQRNREQVTSEVHPLHAKSAINLVNYLSLRSFDLRKFQRRLGYLGMSRLARAESHVEASLRSTLYYLRILNGESPVFPSKNNISIKRSERILKKNTENLLGKSTANRRLRMMVTMPTEAANNYEMVENMAKKGMDVARINCAHDTPEVWLQIITNIRRAENVFNRKIKVAMDLNGPKIRTGYLAKSLILCEGDELRLYKRPIHGYNAMEDENRNKVEPASVSCTFPLALNYVKENGFVYFDDGVIKGRIKSLEEDFVSIKIIRADNNGSKLRADKGINFPGAAIPASGLTDLDKEHLRLIAEYADIVNFSYVNNARDVQDMIDELTLLGVQDRIGVILKIETQAAYENLVDILLRGLKLPKVGVMIARGDLALEIGWNRMGSIQKELLNFCNATHVPVVWATDVMTKLAKKGFPSRAEITDAVIASRAECVMLNKGRYILKAIELLDQIIVSSELYQDKNAPMLPRLTQLA